MERDYKFILLIGALVFFILIIGLVLADVLSTPNAEFSFNSRDSNLYNFTINRTIRGLVNLNYTYVNFTFPLGFTFTLDTNGTNSSVANTTHTFSNMSNATAIILTFNRSYPGLSDPALTANETKAYFWFNMSMYTPGNYTIAINTLDHTNVTNRTTVQVSINDTIAPNVTVTYPVNGTNYSLSQIYFNLTVADYKRLNSGCWYTLNNGTNNVSMSNRSATLFNATNTSIRDTKYVAQFWCNDTANNINNSNSMKTYFTIDTTGPTHAYTCAPTEVGRDGIITCSCTASDGAGVGVNRTTYTVNPVTTTPGTYTTSCTSYDHLQNSRTTTKTYTVLSGGTGGGSGGGSQTLVETYKEFSEIKKITRGLAKYGKVKVKINDKEHAVTVKELTTTSATIEVASTPQTATLNIGEEKKFDITEDGYYDMKVTLDSIAVGKAYVTLDSIKEKVPESEEAKTVGEKIGQGFEELKESKGLNSWIWIIAIVVVVLIIIGYFIKRKK